MDLASMMSKSNLLQVNYRADSKLNLALKLANEHILDDYKNNIVEDDIVIEPDCNVTHYLHPSCKIIGGNEKVNLLILLFYIFL